MLLYYNVWVVSRLRAVSWTNKSKLKALLNSKCPLTSNKSHLLYCLKLRFTSAVNLHRVWCKRQTIENKSRRIDKIGSDVSLNLFAPSPHAHTLPCTWAIKKRVWIWAVQLLYICFFSSSSYFHHGRQHLAAFWIILGLAKAVNPAKMLMTMTEDSKINQIANIY